jgi:hypothetical protein
MPKKESAAKRLAEWQALQARTHFRVLRSPRGPFQLNPLRDQAIIDAFKDFNLDPEKPYDWHLLMGYFADAHYGRRKRGKPPSWTSDRLCQLCTDFYALKNANPGESDEQICGRLADPRKTGAEIGRRYVELSPGTIRRKLVEARARVHQLCET